MINQEFIDNEKEIWSNIKSWATDFSILNYYSQASGLTETLCNCYCVYDHNKAIFGKCQQIQLMTKTFREKHEQQQNRVQYLVANQTPFEYLDLNNLTQEDKDKYYQLINEVEAVIHNLQARIDQSYSSRNEWSLTLGNYPTTPQGWEQTYAVDLNQDSWRWLPYDPPRSVVASIQFSYEYAFWNGLRVLERLEKIRQLKTLIDSSPTKQAYLIESYTRPTTTTETTTTSQSNPLIALLGLGLLLNMG